MYPLAQHKEETFARLLAISWKGLGAGFKVYALDTPEIPALG
jgi:hypothetical protein